MKKILALLLLCVITITAHAEIIILQTSGITKVSNGQTTTLSGDYAFSLDNEKRTLFITNNTPTYSSFGYTGTYKIQHMEKVRDSHMGEAFVLLVSKNDIDYVITITSKAISFSRSGQTDKLCWHFHLND